MDGRSKGKQNERHDADRFANQQTLRNRMFRNIAQDVPREWQKGRKGGNQTYPNSAKSTQNAGTNQPSATPLVKV